MKHLLFVTLLFLHFASAGKCVNDFNFNDKIYGQILAKKTDTIHFLAKYTDLGKVSQREVLLQLGGKGLIKFKNYKSALAFIPLGSFDSFYLPYKDTDQTMVNLLVKEINSEKIICITGVIFRGFEKVNKKPFFLIDRISFQ